MKYSEIREKKVAAYTFKLNAGLISALQSLYNFWEKNKRGADLGELSLGSVSQYTNFNQLSNFGLARRFASAKDKGLAWYPTREGIAFLQGKSKCWDLLATLDDEVLPHTHPAWETHKKMPQLKWVWELSEDKRYKQYEEYAQEKGWSTDPLLSF